MKKNLDDFYRELQAATGLSKDEILPPDLQNTVGHFNVFCIHELIPKVKVKPTMPFARKTFYKVSFVDGKNIAEYADKTIPIERKALMFSTPHIPYNWMPQDMNQRGYMAIFTKEFLSSNRNNVGLDDLPIYRPGGYPVFSLSDEEAHQVELIFQKMHLELRSGYTYKYDLLRNYLLEIIHFGQKLQPPADLYNSHSSSARVSALFTELLERQFPIESPSDNLKLRTPKDYADQLSIHVNYLNRVLKEETGETTKNLISKRITQEAKILLKQTDWNISQVAFSLGFEEVAHFSNFFKKQTSYSPLAFRN